MPCLKNYTTQEILNGCAELGVRVEVKSESGKWAKGKFYRLPSRPEGQWIFVPDTGCGASDGTCYGVLSSEVIMIEISKKVVHVRRVL